MHFEIRFEAAGVSWLLCRDCLKVHPDAAPHLDTSVPRALICWSGAWPYLSPVMATPESLAQAAETMRALEQAPVDDLPYDLPY